MRAPGRLETKEGRSQATSGTLSLKAASAQYSKGHPSWVFTNTRLFLQFSGKEDTLASLDSFRLLHLQGACLSPLSLESLSHPTLMTAS